MIAKEVDDNSGHLESDEMEMVRAIKLGLKHNREDLDFNVVDPRPSKKPRYHRHTPHQINGMEAFFKECPHPIDKQRRELGRELGLEPPQVKFWFQNKRNQAKTQLEHIENIHLRMMNERLRVENMMYKEALCGVVCACCGNRFGIGEVSSEELQMKMENDVLRKEIYRISTMARMYVGKPLNSPLFDKSINN